MNHPDISPLAARLARAKWAFSTRRAERFAVRTLIADRNTAPLAGDLVLATVTAVGQHNTVELPTGRKAFIHPGDEIVVCYGNRYAPDQFEAVVPPDLGGCNLVAGGGIAARQLQQHEKVKGATAIVPAGLLGNADGAPINVKSFALPRARPPRIPAIAVFGTSMNAGKTTTAASLIRGLAMAGYRVGAAKVTGTGAGNDLWSMKDAGAMSAYDFTDVGFATTYLAPARDIIDGAATLLAALAIDGAEVAVLEVADGMLQEETAALAASPDFRALISASVFAAADSMGAIAGVGQLRAMGHRVAAVSGIVTRAPLHVRELAPLGIPVMGIAELSDGAIAAKTFGPLLNPVVPEMAMAG